MKMTAIYMRVSSDKQVREGDSLSAQRHDLMEYINNRPDLILAGEYLDDGVSGTKYKERQELQRLMDDVRNKKIDLILMTKFDRFFRSVKDFVLTQELLQKYNVDWMAINDLDFDTTTPSGKFVLTSMMAVGELEAGLDSQRIRDVQAYKLSQGEVISGSTPPGYSIESKHMVPNSDAQNVLTVFETYARTGNMNETMLLTSGLSGIPKSKSGLKRMLKNPFYIGRHPSGIDGFCTPIVTNELYEDVQRLLVINIKRDQKETYLFSGLIRCSECGHAFGANTRRRKRGAGELKIIHQYRCSKHYNFRPAQCDNAKVVTETALEKYLVDNIAELMAGAIFEYEAEIAPAKDRSAQISALEKKISRLKELYINELISIDEYKEDRENYMKQIEELRAQQDCSPQRSEKAVESMRRLSNMDIRAVYEDLNQEERRRFWRGIIRAIHFGKDRSISVEFLSLSSGNK